MGRVMLALLLLPVAHAYYLPLDQNAAPFLRTSDGSLVDWSSGRVAALTDTSRAVRVSSRGIHFYDHDVRPWGEAAPCTRSATALCVTVNGSLVFPENDPPRYKTSRCGIHSKGRVLVSDDVNDISACDVFHGQLDVLYWNNQLHFDVNNYLPDWAYVLVAIAVFYLVISLGQNIARIMGDKDAICTPVITEVICAFLLVFIPSMHHPRRIFVSHNDFDLYCVVTGYIGLYLLRHLFEQAMEVHVYTFNVITSTLLLVTARLYNSFETPYASVFLFLFLTRLFHKLNNPCRRLIDSITIALDGVLVSLHYSYCFVPSFWDPQAAPVYLAAMATVCHFIGLYTFGQT